MRFPEVVVQGTSYEMGEQIGRLFKDQIREMLHHWIDPKKIERISQLVQEYRPIIHAMDSSYMEEIEGIQAGASILSWEALYLHTRWEVEETMKLENEVESEDYNKAAYNNHEGCSTFAFSGDMVVGGNILHGTNHDVSVWSRNQVVAIHMKSSDHLRLFMLAYPGSITLDGMNQNGLCIAGNSLYAIKKPEEKIGIPHGLFKRLLLKQHNLIDCIELTRRLVHEGMIRFSGNFTISDAFGDLACLELINGYLDIIRPQSYENYVIHTNHLQSIKEEMLAQQGDFSQSSNTVERLDHMIQLIEHRSQKVDLRWVQTMLMDHTHYPRSICSHVSENYHTAYSMIMLPKSQEVWITVGNPCKSSYYKISTSMPKQEYEGE